MPTSLQLRVLDLDLSWRKPVGAHLEDVANGQPRVVAEGLAVHDERVRLDPLDGHPQMTESSSTPAPLKMKRATGLPLWSPGRRLYIRRRLNQASMSSPKAAASSGGRTAAAAGRRPPMSVCWSLVRDATTSIDGHDPLCPLGHVARFAGLQRQRELLDVALVVAQQRPQGDLVVAIAEGRVGFERRLEGQRADGRSLAPEARRGRRSAGRGVGGRQAQDGVAHGREASMTG